jgi:sulfonate transport system ATP-binding protein
MTMPLSTERRRTHTASGREIEPELRRPGARQNFARSAGAAIRLRGLGKDFGGVVVLKSLDLDIEPGQFVAIVGKSGCGKSTLLRLLVDLDAPTAGSIAFLNDQGDERPTNKRIVFQEPRLLPWASIGENVAVGLGPRSDGKDERVAEAIEAVQLSEKAGEWPARLSGGQRQRAALARALVSQPDFLAMDEPLGALDALTRITMQELVEQVWQEQGFTALFVTHDVSEAVALADRVIVLNDGKIALDVVIDLPRPRKRGDAAFAALERQLLDAIFEE